MAVFGRGRNWALEGVKKHYYEVRRRRSHHHRAVPTNLRISAFRCMVVRSGLPCCCRTIVPVAISCSIIPKSVRQQIALI